MISPVIEDTAAFLHGQGLLSSTPTRARSPQPSTSLLWRRWRGSALLMARQRY